MVRMVDAEQWNAFTALHRQMNHHQTNNKKWECWMLRVHDAGRQPTWNDSAHHIFWNMIKKCPWQSRRRKKKEKYTRMHTKTTWLWLSSNPTICSIRFHFLFVHNEKSINREPEKRKRDSNQLLYSFHKAHTVIEYTNEVISFNKYNRKRMWKRRKSEEVLYAYKL